MGKGSTEGEPQPGAPAARAADRPTLAITAGDPCGIGPEIVLKALSDERCQRCRLVVLGDEGNLRLTARELRIRWPFAFVVQELPASWDRPILLDLDERLDTLVPGQVSKPAGLAAAHAIETASHLALAGVVDGIVTAPIHKEALSLAGVDDPGHTEMLQRLTGAPRVAMLFWTEDFSVALLTTHVSLTEAIRRIRPKRVLEQLVFVEREWRRWLGRAPRIAVCGLNPHASEGGRFGHEEQLHIEPAIKKAQAKGLLVKGPIAPDAVFSLAKDGRFDLVFALYHDQATIPVKFAYGRKAVNVTLGLPFVRTSVDHGTAFDIAGKGVADPESVVQSVCLAARMVLNRA